MIKSNKLLSMAEAMEYVKKDKDSETDVVGFIKKFTKLNVKDAKDMREKLQALDLMKIDSEHIVKIIDLLPETEEEVNKICVGRGLSEDENKKILEIVKEFK